MKNEKLKKARKERGFTQQQLATKVGVALITLRRWEYGSLFPSEDNRARLCQILGKAEAELGFAGLPEETTAATPSPQERPLQGDENRKTMIRRVETLWISGVLDHSLAPGKLIHLRVREQPDAVLNPWAESVQESNLPPQPLSARTHIAQVYDDTDRAFLLLGSPGAGKTTLLLELTHDLLSRAKANETHPIPVVFNLSSWSQKRQSIKAWMIEELGSKYQVPHKLAEEWVAASLILPLLDGLDEVAQIHRKECVETINAYRREHGFLPMVVCCRTSEYLALGTHIALNKAIAIEPLTLQQIEQYIGKEGKRLNSVKTALSSDQSLREMVSTPLMLTVISQAFQNTPLDTLLSIDDPAERRRLIFKKYVEVVLNRRGQERRYSPEQTQHWLTWLAKKMQATNQSEYHIERMQPDWLEHTESYQSYHLMINRIIFGLSTFVSAGLFALFRGDSFPNQPGLFYWLGGGNGSSVLGWMQAGLGPYLKGALSMTLIFGLVAVLIGTLVEARVFMPTSRSLQRTLWSGLRYGSVLGIGIGIFALFIFSRTLEWDVALLRSIILTLSTWFHVIVLVGIVTFLKSRRSTRPLQNATRGVHPFREGSIDFLFISICSGIGFAGPYALQSGTLFNPIVLTNASITSFFFGCLFLVVSKTDLVARDPEIRPAEIVSWSWKNVITGSCWKHKEGTSTWYSHFHHFHWSLCWCEHVLLRY